jgi:putative ABC transport system permease protein
VKRFWYLRRRLDSIQSEVDEELRTHLEMKTDELIGAGMREDEARREALRQFGDLTGTLEYCRRQDIDKERTAQRRLLVEDFVQDLRIGLRGLIRAPMTTLIIITTVGLGIGATTAIFAAVDTALLRPLPYREPEQLVRLYTDSPPNKFRFSAADYLALDSQQTTFERVAAYNPRQMTFTDGATAERTPGKLVTWTYFATLGVRPALGRDFEPAEGKPGGPAAAIVSHRFWQERLGGRADAVGRPIRLDGDDYTVVGVLPAAVGPLERNQELFVAARLETPRRKGPFLFLPIARLKASRPAAAEELHAINKRIFPIWQASYQDEKATWSMMDLREYVVGDVGAVAGLAVVAVALVWLIACANASSLLIARVTSRHRELGVRAALGASRGRVVRYLLAESLLLAIGAATIGIPLAYAGIRVLRDFGAAYFPRTAEIALDGPVLWLLIGLTLGSALLFGLVPAIHGGGRAEARLDDGLRSSGRSSTGSLSVRRLRRVLVGSQFAVATPLLVVAGLLLASLSALGKVDLGFDTRDLISGSLLLPASQYPAARADTFWQDLRRRVEAIPGVSAVAYADGRPPNDIGNHNNFDLEDKPTAPGASQPVVPWIAVSPEYFHLLGLRLLEGRLLDERDARAPEGAEQSIVVDRAWAHRFFPDGAVIGRRLKEGGCTQCPWTVVVGVVSDVKYDGLDKPDDGSVYSPWNPQSHSQYLLVRTSVRATTILSQLRDIVRRMDASVPLSGVATIDELVDLSLSRPRSLSMLVAAVAGVALLLSLIGIYGVMAYYVQQHAKEIAIRLALGGGRARLFRLVVSQGMRVVVAGVAVGLFTAFAATRAMSSLLFGVNPVDPQTFAAVAGLLTLVALAACALPAGRATAVHPAAVLREE